MTSIRRHLAPNARWDVFATGRNYTVVVVSILRTIGIVAFVYILITMFSDEGITSYCLLELVIIELFFLNVDVKFAYKFTV